MAGAGIQRLAILFHPGLHNRKAEKSKTWPMNIGLTPVLFIDAFLFCVDSECEEHLLNE